MATSATRRPRRRARRGSTRSSIWPPWSASASRCTRSSDTRARTRWRPRPSSSGGGAVDPPRAGWWSLRRCRSTARASTSAQTHGRVAPGPRPEEQLLSRQWECLLPSMSARAARRSAPRETKPLIPTSIYAITKRDHEELSLVAGACLRDPDRRAPLLQRLRARTGALEPYTGVAAIFASRLMNGRPPLIFEDGRQRATSSTSATSSAGSLLALSQSGADGEAVNVGTGTPTSVLDVARVLSRGLGAEIEPEIVGQYRAGDVRHCYADTTKTERLLGFRAQIALEDGMRELLGVARRSGGDEIVSMWPCRAGGSVALPAKISCVL